MATLNDGSGPSRPNPGISPMTGSAHGGPGSGSGGSPPDPPVARRPVPPHRPERNRKMRWLRVGGLVVMLAGAATVAYVVNAVWISGARTGDAQEQLAADFAAAQQAATTTTTTTTPAEDDPTIGSSAPTSTTNPAEDTSRPNLHADLPAIISEEPPAPTEALGRILIPAIGVDWIMVEGVSTEALNKGPGHMPGTALPGQPGNSVVSGHRTTYGAPFFDLDLLQPGDTIQIETLIGAHIYEVVEVRIVAPTDVWVTNQVDGAWLTLTTCNPKYSARERLIVFARLVAGPNYDAVAATLTGDEAPPQPPS